MNNLTDGERDVLRELEADARDEFPVLTNDEPEITLRYVEVGRDLSLQTAFQPQEVKDAIGARVMARLGIPVPDGVRPIEAWLSAMCAANDLPDVRPAPAALVDALQSDPDAWNFFYALI